MKEVITMRQQKRIASTFTGFVLIISFLSILRLFLVISNIKSAIDVNKKSQGEFKSGSCFFLSKFINLAEEN